MYDIYVGRYKEFIESIKLSRPDNVYFEYSHRHHIIPKCLFDDPDPSMNSDDNLIYLTCKEHLIAHKILAEDYPSIYGLVHAYWLMSNTIDGISPEDYEEAMILHSLAMRGNSINKGRVLTEDHKKKLSLSMRNKRNRLGYHTHEDTKKKISESMTGNKNAKGVNFTDEIRYKISEGVKKANYHCKCKRCNAEFTSNTSGRKYCDNCRKG